MDWSESGRPEDRQTESGQTEDGQTARAHLSATIPAAFRNADAAPAFRGTPDRAARANGAGGITPGRITHWRIFRRYWLSIIGTFALILLSTALWLFQPFLLGLAIDDLVLKEWRGVAYLAALQIAVLLIGAARRFYDTRVYTRIYRDIGAEAVANAQDAGLEITRTAARANLLREVVNFFEFRIPGILRAAIDLVGSITMLAFLSWNVFLASLGAMAVIALVSVGYMGRLFKLNKGYNDQLEREIDAYQANSRSRTDEHLSALAKWQVRRSDAQVAIFGLTSLAIMAVVLYALYDTVSVKEAAIGAVFAVVTYVRRFQIAVFEFPLAFQQVIRTLEITRRLNQVEETPLSPARKDAARARYASELREIDLPRNPVLPRWF